MKQKREQQPQPNTDEVLRRMLATPPQPHVQKSKKKAKNIDPSLLALIQLDHAGFLEPFVLFNRADNGIAKDYAAYRTAHRDVLRKYLDEFVVPKTPAKP